MQPTILVPLEDSTQARRVLPYVCSLAGAGHGRLALVQAIADPAVGFHAQAELAAIAQELGHAGVAVDTAVELGEPGPTIVNAATARGADLIGMATDRWSDLDQWLNGSVVEWVLRHTSIPLLIIPPGCTARSWESEPAPHVLIPLDGSAFAEDAIDPTLPFVELLGGDLTLLRAVTDTETSIPAAQIYLDEVAARFSRPGFSIGTHVVRGRPAGAIQDTARLMGSGLIAMATHGRTGLARLLLGSIASRTLHMATVPLLLVRPAALRSRMPEAEEGLAEHTPFLIAG